MNMFFIVILLRLYRDAEQRLPLPVCAFLFFTPRLKSFDLSPPKNGTLNGTLGRKFENL